MAYWRYGTREAVAVLADMRRKRSSLWTMYAGEAPLLHCFVRPRLSAQRAHSVSYPLTTRTHSQHARSGRVSGRRMGVRSFVICRCSGEGCILVYSQPDVHRLTLHKILPKIVPCCLTPNLCLSKYDGLSVCMKSPTADVRIRAWTDTSFHRWACTHTHRDRTARSGTWMSSPLDATTGSVLPDFPSRPFIYPAVPTSSCVRTSNSPVFAFSLSNRAVGLSAFEVCTPA